MKNLKHATPATIGPGLSTRPDPGLILEGSPEFTTWPAFEGRIDSGIWAATPGKHRVIRDEVTLEHFYILEGEIELCEDGCDTPRRFGARDLVVIEPGFRGTWQTITPVRKVYFTARI